MAEVALFVSATTKLKPADAVAGLIVLEDGRYLMQRRDTVPGIFYPEHWGCFGGAVNEGEAPLQALRRELREELEFEVGAADEFTRFDFDFGRLGQPKVFRIYYETPMSLDIFRRLVLHEGAEMRAFDGAQLLTHEKITPYDAFAVWMHFSQRRLRVGSD